MVALDASKIFDNVNDYALFTKLVATGAPVYLLNVVINLHLKLSGCMNWCGAIYSVLYIKSGMRQGRIYLSCLFSAYIDDLILKLRNGGYGCY